jgi:hypothetical protein
MPTNAENQQASDRYTLLSINTPSKLKLLGILIEAGAAAIL